MLKVETEKSELERTLYLKLTSQLQQRYAIDLKEYIKVFYLIGYVNYETLLVHGLKQRLQKPPSQDDDDEEEDILFQFDFAHNNLNIQQQNLPQTLCIEEYKKITANFIQLGWHSTFLTHTLTEIIALQVERKIEVSRQKFEQMNLLVSIEKWSEQIIIRFFEFILDIPGSEHAQRTIGELKQSLQQIVLTCYMNLKTEEMFDILNFLNENKDRYANEFPPCILDI